MLLPVRACSRNGGKSAGPRLRPASNAPDQSAAAISDTAAEAFADVRTTSPDWLLAITNRARTMGTITITATRRKA